MGAAQIHILTNGFRLIAGTLQHAEAMDKIAFLSDILQQNPQDAFARYGLAMEHVNQGQTETALAEFTRLLELHPDYTAGYFMSAQTLLKIGRTDDAIKRLKGGIESALRTGNHHALSEMQALLDEVDR